MMFKQCHSVNIFFHLASRPREAKLLGAMVGSRATRPALARLPCPSAPSQDSVRWSALSAAGWALRLVSFVPQGLHLSTVIEV